VAPTVQVHGAAVLAYVGKKIAQIAQIRKTPKMIVLRPIFWAKPVFRIAQTAQ